MSLSVASLRQVQHINLTNGGFAHFAVTWRARSRTAGVSCLFKQPWSQDGFNHQASLTCIVTLVRSRVQDYCSDDTRNSSSYTLCCYLYKTGGAFSLLKSFFFLNLTVLWNRNRCSLCAHLCILIFTFHLFIFLINFLPYLHHQSELFYISAVHVNTSPNSQNLSCRVKRSDNIHGDTSDHFSQSINRFLWRVGSKLCPGLIWVSLNSNQELCIYLLFNYIFIFSSHTSHISAHRSSCSSSISLIVHQLCLFPLWLWSGLQRRQQKAMTEGGGK